MSYNTVELREEGAKEPQSHAASSSTDTNDETSRNQPLHVNLSIQGGNCGIKEKQALDQGCDFENQLKRVNGIAELQESTRDEKRQRYSLTDEKNTLHTMDCLKNPTEFQYDNNASSHLKNQEGKAVSSGHETMIHCPESSCSKYPGVEDDTSSSSSSSDDGLARIKCLQSEIKKTRQSFGVIHSVDKSIPLVIAAKKEDIPISSVTRKRHEKIEIDLTNDDDDYDTKDDNTQGEIEEKCAEQQQATSRAPVQERSGWMFKPPQHNEPPSKIYGGVFWHWCSRCENGMGKWTDHNAYKHGEENNVFQFTFSQSKARVSSPTDLSTSTVMENLPLNFEESNATNDQPKTKQEDTSYEQLLARKKRREEVIDLLSDSDETGNEDEFDVNDDNTAIANEQKANDSNQENCEAEVVNPISFDGVMPSTHCTEEVQTNDSSRESNDMEKIDMEKHASPDSVIESTHSTQELQIDDSNEGTNEMGVEISVPPDNAVHVAPSANDNVDRMGFSKVSLSMKKRKVDTERSRHDMTSNSHLEEIQEEENCKTTKTLSINTDQSLKANTMFNAVESKGMLEQSNSKEMTGDRVNPFHDMILQKKNKEDEHGEVSVESPHKSEDLTEVRHFTNAIGKLEEMKERTWKEYSNERKCPVLDSEKVNFTDLEYYTFQQFFLDSIKDSDKHHQKQIGYGCLTCLHCGSKNVCLQDQSFHIFWNHVIRICEDVPSQVKESLMTLKKISNEQNITSRKARNSMSSMKAIFLRVKDSQITETLKLSSRKELSMQDSSGRVEPSLRESYESNRERQLSDPRSSSISRLEDKAVSIPFSPKRRLRIPNYSREGKNGRRNFSRDPSELKEMELLDFQKCLTNEHYPTLTFSILNEEKGKYYLDYYTFYFILLWLKTISDQLFDFTAYVGKSRIPNSGNGAFLRLDKIRVGIQEKDYSTFPLTRCSLVANMPCGKVCNVTIGPNEIHEDEKAFRSKNYIRDDSLTFSSYDEGNGIINLGSYGPFFVSDLKGNHHFEVKNFLFDFEPQGWSYGYDEEDETEESKNGDLILDITDEKTGETHLRARENLPMHVNEVGHDKSLEHNVTPLQDIDGIYYFAHIKSPMKVGSEVELLVNYGDHYETVRERKGYGLSNVPDDSNEIFRARRNQAARIVTLEHIHSQTQLHGLCVLVISLEKTILGVHSITDECFRSSSLQNSSRRQVRSRLRMHWISTCIIDHIDFIKKKQKKFWDHELLAESDIRKIASKMKIPPDLLRRIGDNEILTNIAYEEILEEVIFALSMPTIACNLPHPLDTCMYTKVTRKLFSRLVKEVVLKVHIGTSDEATAMTTIYELALLASRHVIPNDELSDVSKIMLGLDTSDNKVISDYLQKGLDKDGDQAITLEKKDAKRIRCKKIDNEVKVDTDWYILQNVRVIHAVACEYLKFEKYYSLQSLCEQLGVNVEAAEEMVKTRIEEPYDKEKYVQQKDHRFKDSINKTSHIKRTKRFSADAQKIFDREGGRQMSGFIPNVHPNVERNRNNLTFWEEKPGGDLLPEGWIIHIHNREQGPTSTSHLDWYWFTKGGKKLRSKPEIRRYIECLEKAGGDDEEALKLFGKSR